MFNPDHPYNDLPPLPLAQEIEIEAVKILKAYTHALAESQSLL